MLERLSALVATLRPRTIARTAKSVEDLQSAARDLRKSVHHLEEWLKRSTDRTAALEGEVRQLRDAVAELRVRESRLRTIHQMDLEQADALASLDDVLRADVVAAHVQGAVDAATVHGDPFPHLVVENLLPRAVFDTVVAGIPPVEFFDGAENKQRIVVPFELAPAFSRRVWSFLLREAVDRALGPALLRALGDPIGEWLRATWPQLGDRPLDSTIRMQTTDGRILLRGRGYVIPPHRDPKWGFVTCLLYLARPGDSERWGTQLYAVEDDGEAENVSPHWIRAERCRLMKDVPFRANTMLVFLNSHGAHGAHIPADAEPADLKRYIYQFRIGPAPDSIRRLVSLLPAERRGMWAGKVVDYA